MFVPLSTLFRICPAAVRTLFGDELTGSFYLLIINGIWVLINNIHSFSPLRLMNFWSFQNCSSSSRGQQANFKSWQIVTLRHVKDGHLSVPPLKNLTTAGELINIKTENGTKITTMGNVVKLFPNVNNMTIWDFWLLVTSIF